MSRKFSNLHPTKVFERFRDPFRERRSSGPLRPAEPISAVEPDFLGQKKGHALTFAWLGHASVFLHLHGKSILIDPVFSERCSPVPFVGPKHFPGRILEPADLPEIDLVLITHNHYDHLDRKTIRQLDGQVKRYVVPTGVGGNLRKFGVQADKITELGWYEEWNTDGLTIACTPSQHNSIRTPFDADRTLWGSFVLKDEDFTVFDTGDGGFADHFQEIRKRYGRPDLGIMECGQYGEDWHSSHMFPEESVQACKILGSRLSIPMHWGAYILSTHAWDEPPKRFRQRAEELGIPYRIPKLYEMIVLYPSEENT